MIYTIKRDVLLGNLSGSGLRRVEIGSLVDLPFLVENHHTNVPQVAARFSPNSIMRLLRCRVSPLLAKGLREGADINLPGLVPCTFHISGFANGPIVYDVAYEIERFGEWVTIDTLFPANGVGPMKPDVIELRLESIVCNYDAFGIQEKYVGQPFGFVIEIELETTSGIV